MKNLVATIIAVMVAFTSFAQGIQPNKDNDPTRKYPPVVNKREKRVKHKAPGYGKNYNKNATARSKKDMGKQVDRFQTPQYANIVKGAKKAREKTGKGR